MQAPKFPPAAARPSLSRRKRGPKPPTDPGDRKARVPVRLTRRTLARVDRYRRELGYASRSAFVEAAVIEHVDRLIARRGDAYADTEGGGRQFAREAGLLRR